MKKIVLVTMALLSMTTSFAAGNEMNASEAKASVRTVSAYDMTVNYTRLAVVLGLDFNQMDAVEFIHERFCKDMKLAAKASSDKQKHLAHAALDLDLEYMGYVLTDNQFAKYKQLMNVTFNNRGLND